MRMTGYSVSLLIIRHRNNASKLLAYTVYATCRFYKYTGPTRLCMGVFEISEKKEEHQFEMVSVYRNNRSLAATVPCDIAEEADISEGTQLKIQPTENGFEAEVIQL